LEYVEFLEQVRQTVWQRAGKELKISVTRVLKNNRTQADSMTILEDGENIAPAIYLTPFYEQYTEGRSIDAIADEILEIYRQSRRSGTIDMTFYKDYEKVRGNIACKLVNYEKNQYILKRIPHCRFLDLAVVYYCEVAHPLIGEGSILVQNAHLELWGVSREELHDTALINTRQQHPYELSGIAELLGGMLEDEEELADMQTMPMYVLTSKEKYYGAVNLLFDDVLEKVAVRLDGDYYVLPSSIHECMIIPVTEQLRPDDLQQMVHDINEEHVAVEEVLGESVYRYLCEERRLVIVRQGGETR
jgi:hypothetical protein